jgi:hypothetical protein
VVEIKTAEHGDMTMIERIGKHRRLGSAAIVARLFVFGAGATHADELAGCYRATIPAPIVLPDGSEHPEGDLRICTTRQLSPVEWLHVMYIGGGAIGAFRGRDTVIERGIEPRPPEFVFLRGSDGSLRLFGFTTSAPSGARLHKLIPVAGLRGESDVVLIAARQDEAALAMTR